MPISNDSIRDISLPFWDGAKLISVVVVVFFFNYSQASGQYVVGPKCWISSSDALKYLYVSLNKGNMPQCSILTIQIILNCIGTISNNNILSKI